MTPRINGKAGRDPDACLRLAKQLLRFKQANDLETEELRHLFGGVTRATIASWLGGDIPVRRMEQIRHATEGDGVTAVRILKAEEVGRLRIAVREEKQKRAHRQR